NPLTRRSAYILFCHKTCSCIRTTVVLYSLYTGYPTEMRPEEHPCPTPVRESVDLPATVSGQRKDLLRAAHRRLVDCVHVPRAGSADAGPNRTRLKPLQQHRR